MARIVIRPPDTAHALVPRPDMVLDFEALGKGSRPVIVGLGAALFGVDEDGLAWASPCADVKGWPISTRGQDGIGGRDLDHETIGWWLDQPEEVREPVRRALGYGSRAGLPDLRATVLATWQAACGAGVGRWWAKPSAYDLALWWQLVGEYAGTALVHGCLWDVRSLWDAAETATGALVREPDLRPKHDPAVDALATACACADALALLVGIRTRATAAFDPA